MKKAGMALLMLASGCAGGLSMGASGEASMQGLSTALSSAGAEGATAQLDGGAFYTITTEVDGAPLALTFVLPEGAARGTVTTMPSMSAVTLRPVTKEPTQLWRAQAQDVKPGDVYTLYSKVSDDDSRLTGVLELQDPDNRFSDTTAYRSEHNRLTVGLYSNENVEYWIIKNLPNGKFRIMNMLAAAESLNPPGAEPFPTRWNEERSLAAVKGPDGVVGLRQEPTADTPAQQWTISKVGP